MLHGWPGVQHSIREILKGIVLFEILTRCLRSEEEKRGRGEVRVRKRRKRSEWRCDRERWRRGREVRMIINRPSGGV